MAVSINWGPFCDRAYVREPYYVGSVLSPDFFGNFHTR